MQSNAASPKRSEDGTSHSLGMWKTKIHELSWSDVTKTLNIVKAHFTHKERRNCLEKYAYESCVCFKC